jgi:hypothetical protein
MKQFAVGPLVAVLTAPVEGAAGYHAAPKKKKKAGAVMGLLGGVGGGFLGVAAGNRLRRVVRSRRGRRALPVAGALIGGTVGGAAAGASLRGFEFSELHEFATITRLRDRIAFVKSLRRQLEKKAKSGHSSHTITGIRSVFAPNTKRHGGLTDKALPRAVKVDGQPAILHYRGTGKSTPELLRRPVLETQKWAGGPDPSKVEIVLPSRRARPSQWQSKFAGKETVARPGVHYQKTNVSKAAYYHAHGSEHPTGLISTSVGKKVASNWAVSQGEKAGVLGVYATKARDLLRKKRKAAMVSSWVGEREIAQATGGNMIARRRLKTVPSPEGQWDLRRFEFSELSPLAKSVWRHYYGKLKKQTRGGKLSKHLDGYLPGNKNAGKLGVLYRGTNKQEVEKLVQGRFKSSWTSPGIFRGSPARRATWVASSPQYAGTYAVTDAHPRILAVTPAVLKRRDKKLSARMGETTTTAPIRGGLGGQEMRGLLKGETPRRPVTNALRLKAWRPVPLGAIQKKHFSRIDRGRVEMSRRENLAKQRRQDPIGREAGIPLTGQIAHDRYVIENRRQDIAKRDSNILRAGIAGTAAGAVLGRGRLPLKARLAAGALAGAGSVIGVRAVTHKKGRDAYGGRQPWAARSEAAPAVIGAGAAGYGAYRMLRKRFLKMSDARKVTEFTEKKKRQMNPYVMAGLSGAASGALLGAVPILRKGWKAKSVAKSMATSAAVSGAIVGGGAAVGSKIIGPPKANEGSAFTKRAAIGGVLVGAGTGAAGGLLLRSRGLRSGLASVRRQTSRMPSEVARKIGAAPHRGVRSVQRGVKDLAKEWSPMDAIQKAGPLQASVLGAGAGGAYGLYQGADEGQQVDSIRNFRKDAKRYGRALSARVGTVELEKDWRDARRESRATAWRDAGAGTGALVSGVGVGGGAAYAGWRAGKALNQIGATAADARKVTRSARVANVKITRASRWIKRQLTTFPTLRKFKMQSAERTVEFEKPFFGYNKKRHARTGGLNDSYRQQYNRDHGSNLKRPVTTEPSKLKPGSKASKRRASFCARMGGMPGPTSKDGKLTPKGAALKRWNCSAKQQLIEMNDRTYRPGSTAEIRSMKQTPAVKEILKKENARGAWKHRLRTLMKVLPFEAQYEFQTMVPMPVSPYDERERLKRQLLVTGAVAAPVGGVTYAGWRSLRKSASAMRLEEDRAKLGQKLRAERRASMAVGGQVKSNKFGPSGPITREPLPTRKALQPDTLERNQATNKAIGVGKRYEQEINNRYRAGGKMKLVHSRGERKAMRAALAALRTKYKFARKGKLHEFTIYARDQETGRAAGFYDYVQGRPMTRKNPVTGNVETAPITTGAFISAARRKAEEYNRTRKRGMGLVRDVSEVAAGKKTKKREWEKGWFQNKLQTAAGAAALLGAGVIYRKGGLRTAPPWAKKFRNVTDKAIGKAQNYRATAEDRLGKMIGLSARLANSVRMFAYQDYYTAPGWDLRDARGNSARVFSPKAKKRMRRQAEWYEKKDGERKILGGLALAGTIAGTAGGLLVGGKVFGKRGYKLGYDRGVTGGMGQKLAADIIKKENKALRAQKRKIIKGPWKDKTA